MILFKVYNLHFSQVTFCLVTDDFVHGLYTVFKRFHVQFFDPQINPLINEQELDFLINRFIF